MKGKENGTGLRGELPDFLIHIRRLTDSGRNLLAPLFAKPLAGEPTGAVLSAISHINRNHPAHKAPWNNPNLKGAF